MTAITMTNKAALKMGTETPKLSLKEKFTKYMKDNRHLAYIPPRTPCQGTP